MIEEPCDKTSAAKAMHLPIAALPTSECSFIYSQEPGRSIDRKAAPPPLGHQPVADRDWLRPWLIAKKRDDAWVHTVQRLPLSVLPAFKAPFVHAHPLGGTYSGDAEFSPSSAESGGERVS